MKKSVTVIFGGLLCASILSVSLIGSFTNESKDVEGYSTSSLPTTIDLNDTSASNIRSYYSSLNNLSQSERQGNNLLKNLKTILKNGQKYYSYDSGNAIWQIYEIADRDWSKSPASSTTYGSYNSSTKKITNYTYGTSSSSSKNNPYIHALYINRNVTNQTTAWDDHQQTQWGINREHVWPKAEGFETSGAGGARGDPMHLMAGNGYANNIHSNYYYGYVNTSSTYTNCGSKYSNISGNLLGKSKTLGGSTNVFEPQDCDKGDIARAIFYMVARYNYLSNSDSDGIDSNNPNLSLTQQLSDWSSTGYSSTTSKKGYMGVMTDLLAWHHADPVDEYEIHRNNLLYTNYTNNRNPFIDFPEWADFIWGSVNYSGSTYISHSTTPTGYATPSSDTINGYNSGGGSTVSVTGVILSENSISVEEGSDATLTATIAPSNATNQNVSWSTSDASVATVSGGIVTGVKEGSATITVTTSDGGYTATCNVTVTESSGAATTESGSIDVEDGFKGWTKDGVDTYSGGDLKFDTSGDNIYNKSIFSGDVSSYMTKLEVTVHGKINGTPTAANSYKVEALDSSGNVLDCDVLTGASVVTTSEGDTVFTLDNNLSGCTGIKVTYVTKGGGNWAVNSISWTATYDADADPVISSIAVKTAPTKTTYVEGDDFEPTGLVITASYSNSTTVDIPYEDNEDDFEFAPNENLATTDESVTITYAGKTTTQAITVNVQTKTLSSISISGETTSFTVGDTFSFGGTVTAHYSDSSTDDVTSSSSFSGYNMSTSGDQTVTVSYTYKNSTKSTSYSITVSPASDISTITVSIQDYAYDNKWSNGTKYESINLDAVVTATADGGSNTGKYYTSGHEWRFYQSENATLEISVASGYELDSVTIVYNSSNSGILLDSSQNVVDSNVSQEASGSSVTYSVGNSGSATNGQVKVTSISVTYHATGSAPEITGITALVSKTYYVGETISSSDITVKDSNDDTVTSFTFSEDNYRFTYADAASGGSLTNKTFLNAISYSTFTCSLTVQVQRKAYSAPGTDSKTITSSLVFNEIGGGNKNLKSGTVEADSITYAYSNAYYYSGGSALSFGNASDQTGYMKNNTAFDSGITNVTVTSTGRTVNIRYSEDGSSWILKANADPTKIYKYFKIDCVGNTGSNYSNITQVVVTYNKTDTALNVANYIMYEDTNNQCSSKLDIAIDYMNHMSSSELTIFTTSNDYVISTARERLEAWARSQGKSVNYTANNVTLQSNNVVSLFMGTPEANNMIVILLVASLLCSTALTTVIVVKKRKRMM